jgi:hypothetical protein
LTILIDPHDPRAAKAVALATQALIADWPHIRAYWMPSSSDPSKVYLATRVSCECADYRFRGRIRRCYHALAAELVDQARDDTAAF